MSFKSYGSSRIARALNSNSVEFLKVDLETAITFADIALESLGDMDKKTRNQARARQVYDFVIERQECLPLNNQDASEIAEKLKRVKLALTELGEKF